MKSFHRYNNLYYGWPPRGSHAELRQQFARAMRITDGGMYTGGRPYPGGIDQHGIRVDSWDWHLDPVRVVRGSRQRRASRTVRHA